MYGKIKQVVINLSIMLLALMLSVVIGEMLSRTFTSKPGEGKWMGAEKKYYEYDSLYGWEKIPNLDTDRVTAGKPAVKYRINSKSIRGPEYSYDKADNEYRIMILGDSFADGFMIEFDDLFSEVLKSRLNNMREGTLFETINTGTSGWSTDQELLFFQKEGKKYNPDLTVLMFYENDITYNNQPKDWGMYYKPLFSIKGKDLVLTNVPVPKPDIFIIHDPLEPEEKSLLKKFRGWLNVNSYLYKLVKDRIKNTYKLRKIVAEANIIEKSSRKETFFLPIEYKVWEKSPNETVRDSWNITEAMIVKLREETESIGSKLLVFYVPFEGSINREEWRKLKKQYNLNDDDWTPDQPGIVLGNICKKNNIDFLDPTEFLRSKFKETKKNNKRLYDPLDHHWTVEGNRLVGELLAEQINIKYLDKSN